MVATRMRDTAFKRVLRTMPIGDRCEDRRSMQPSEFVNRPFSFDLIRRLPNGATASDFRFVQSGLLRKIPSLFSLQDLPTLIPVPPLSYPNVKSRA